MRNWNQAEKARGRVLAKGFQTTYEELKPEMLERYMTCWKELPDYLWGIETCHFCAFKRPDKFCFQTTYEELKPSLRSARVSEFTSFQTTYEELKRLLSGSQVHDSLELPDYLWGIETNISVPFSGSIILLPDYLWGIETLGRGTAEED